MRELGIDTADLGVEMTTRKILDAEGRIVVEIECPQTLTAWLHVTILSILIPTLLVIAVAILRRSEFTTSSESDI